MDSKTNISALKEKVKKFCEDRDWDQYHNAKELAIAMINECSEVLEHFKYKSATEIDLMFKDAKKKEEISDELGDVFYCLLRLTQRYDIDLSDAFNNKLKKIDKKYPINKSKGSNKKYTEF